METTINSAVPIKHGLQRVNAEVIRVYQRPAKRAGYRSDAKARRPGIFQLDSKAWWKGGVQPNKKADPLRQRCYRAEWAVQNTLPQKTFADHKELALWFRGIMESDWFQRRFPHFFTLTLKYLPGSQAAYAGPIEQKGVREPSGYVEHVTRGRIVYSTWAMGVKGKGGGELTMLHELAHAIIPTAHRHDRRWVRVLLELVKHYMQPEASAAVVASYKTFKVKSSPCRKGRVLSVEHRAKLAACRRAPKSVQSVAAGNVPADSVVPVQEIIA